MHYYDGYSPVKYHYSYKVLDPNDHGLNYGHSEDRNQDKTSGAYHVQLPDGRLQTVKYHVDHVKQSGFIADVNYVIKTDEKTAIKKPITTGPFRFPKANVRHKPLYKLPKLSLPPPNHNL